MGNTKESNLPRGNWALPPSGPWPQAMVGGGIYTALGVVVAVAVQI